MSITLTLKTEISLRLKMDGVTPTAFARQSSDEIARTALHSGNQTVSLGEFFRIDGEADDYTLILEGDLSRVDQIGEGLSEGKIISRGSVGQYAGRNMSGGELTIQGSTGPGQEYRCGVENSTSRETLGTTWEGSSQDDALACKEE